jgi:hypothetical protein
MLRLLLLLLLLLLCGWLGASRLDSSAHVSRHALQVIQQRLRCRLCGRLVTLLLLLLCCCGCMLLLWHGCRISAVVAGSL